MLHKNEVLDLLTNKENEGITKKSNFTSFEYLVKCYQSIVIVAF